jgi:GxxExxY protein
MIRESDLKTIPSYKHSELTDVMIGSFYDVYNELGCGFLESVYRKALRLTLQSKGLRAETAVPVPVFFRGANVGDFRADLVVNELILLELKTAESIILPHEAQLLNYLWATTLEVGRILNFGPKARVRRLLFDNVRKMVRSQRVERPGSTFLESMSSVFMSAKVFACA